MCEAKETQPRITTDQDFIACLVAEHLANAVKSEDPEVKMEAMQAIVANKLYGIGRWYCEARPWYKGGGNKLVAWSYFSDSDRA